MRGGARAIVLGGFVVACGHAGGEGAAPVASVAVAPGEASRSDVAVCEASYKYESDFAEYWAGRTPGGTRREDLPGAEEFVRVCKGVPAPVQRCLHEHYREVHDQECELVWARLDPAARREVDGLFLEAPKGDVRGPASQPALVPVDAGK